MKLHLNQIEGSHTITGHGDGYVAVDGQSVESSLLLSVDQLVTPWTSAGVADLRVDDFATVLDWRPALVVFGSGKTFAFPDMGILAAFSQARIGFEVMDTPAACRTYNVLAAEGRHVVAALLV